MKLNADVLRGLPFALRVEIEENAQRKPLTQSELAFEQRRIMAELRKHRTPGKRSDLKSGTSAKDFAEVRATNVVGKLFNESGRQVEKRLAVVEALEAEPDNAKIAKLVETMDDTGRVNGPFKRLMVMRQAEAIRAEPPPLPGRGPYRVIVADPPWPYDIDSDAPQERATYDYPQMSIAEICDIDVDSIAHVDSILWLWTTNFHMRAAFKVLDAWGFEAKTILTWSKDRQGRGHWLLGQTEHCIMATRGKPTVTLTNQTTLLHAPVREHSQKPEEFYALVEKLCPAPRYAELFSRQPRDKWDGHGDEAQKPAGEWQLSPADVAATESNLGGG